MCWWWWSHHHHSATTRVVDTNLEILTPAPHVVHVTNMRYGALYHFAMSFCYPERINVLTVASEFRNPVKCITLSCTVLH